MTKDFMEEERKINSAEDVDPLIKLKSREVDLRAMEMSVKRKKESKIRDRTRKTSSRSSNTREKWNKTKV
ncbi:MAG: hypothetical protein CM15mV118_140 [uncultured marine virus]|nr:MAG: hypothetical protein CM15mV118_140 [uncultured marine virus]